MLSRGDVFEYCSGLLAQSRVLMDTAAKHWCRGDHESAFALHAEALGLQKEVRALQTQLVDEQNHQLFGKGPRRRGTAV